MSKQARASGMKPQDLRKAHRKILKMKKIEVKTGSYRVSLAVRINPKATDALIEAGFLSAGLYRGKGGLGDTRELLGVKAKLEECAEYDGAKAEKAREILSASLAGMKIEVGRDDKGKAIEELILAGIDELTVDERPEASAGREDGMVRARKTAIEALGRWESAGTLESRLAKLGVGQTHGEDGNFAASAIEAVALEVKRLEKEAAEEVKAAQKAKLNALL